MILGEDSMQWFWPAFWVGGFPRTKGSPSFLLPPPVNDCDLDLDLDVDDDRSNDDDDRSDDDDNNNDDNDDQWDDDNYFIRYRKGDWSWKRPG